MKYLYIFLSVLVLISCNQKPMSEKERAALKQEKKDRQIRKISDAEILEEAKRQGGQIMSQLVVPNDSTNSSFEAHWFFYSDSTNITNPQIKDLMEAYLYAKENQLPADEHIDDLKNGKLIYAKPMDDGIWVIYLDKKELVKGM